MSKRYCQLRGKHRNEFIMKALQFESASWIWGGINDMLLATKSKRAKPVSTEQPTAEEAPLEEEEDDNEEEVEEEEEVEQELLQLLDWEVQMNECAYFGRYKTTSNTRIRNCAALSRRWIHEFMFVVDVESDSLENVR